MPVIITNKYLSSRSILPNNLFFHKSLLELVQILGVENDFDHQTAAGASGDISLSGLKIVECHGKLVAAGTRIVETLGDGVPSHVLDFNRVVNCFLHKANKKKILGLVGKRKFIFGGFDDQSVTQH